MKYAYPQNPTSAVSAMRRYDESTDAATQQSNLERKQDIATVGETVPMVFCSRGDFGNNQDINGGLWISPRLIQLGIEQTNLSMMYLLSQGQITGLDKSSVHWGYAELTNKDSSAEFCSAYEAVPSCLDLDYKPGGSISWTTTVTSSGPGGTGSFVTEDKCQKIVINWNSKITVSGSGTIVGGFGGIAGITKNYGTFPSINGCVRLMTIHKFAPPVTNGWIPIGATSGTDLANAHNSGLHTYTKTTRRGHSCAEYDTLRYYDISKYHLQASWDQTSEVRLDYTVTRISDNKIVESSSVWVRDGATSLTISGLSPAQYRVTFSNLYKERNKPYSTATIPTPQSWTEFWALYTASYPTSSPSSGFVRHTAPGTETQSITSSVTQTIYNQLDFPDLPGGDQQVVGGLADLTMIGIKGDITKLRPIDGPDYFVQAHLFVEQGISVSRLLQGDTGPSRYYPDLVNHLMKTAKVLQNDQIDTSALVLASRMNQRYSLFFNGILQTTTSFAEWITRTAPYFLLTPRQVDGKHGLWPVCPLAPDYSLSQDMVVPDHVVTADQIVEESYRRNYISPKDRKPVCLVMVYRDQPTGGVGQTVTVEVRYPGTALSGPFEQHDMTEFCCRAEHAVYAARYILAKRRYVTHTCSFTMTREGAQVRPGDIVRVDLDLDTTEGDGLTDSIFYQVESVAEGQQGLVRLNLTHFPVDSDGISIVAKEIHSGEVTIQ